MPVVTLAPLDEVFEKMIGIMQEVKARGRFGPRAHDPRRRQAGRPISAPNERIFILRVPAPAGAADSDQS